MNRMPHLKNSVYCILSLVFIFCFRWTMPVPLHADDATLHDASITEERTCMPSAVIKDSSIISEMKTALSGIASWSRGRSIIKIIIVEGWRIQRNEFTGIPSYRTTRADVVLSSTIAGYYIAVPCIFKQGSSFMGLRFSGISYRMRYKWGMYKIAAGNIDKVCDK